MSGHSPPKAEKKSGQEPAKSGQDLANRYHIDYWKKRLFKKVYTWKGERREVDEWSIRLQHLGRREAFALGTANGAAAAAKAKEIATFLEANGWDATRARFKPSAQVSTRPCTVGEFLADVGARSHLKPMTIRRYAVKLRKMIGDIAKVEAGMKVKARRAKYDYATGGRAAWLAKVDGQRLDTLTPDEINGWRNAYVAKAGADPIKRKSAERSAASYLRCVRALFTADVLACLKVKLPPNPFEGVRLKDPGPLRYRSEINAELLLVAAERELRPVHPNAYLALSLCLWAGLRRREADLLLWEQVDLADGTLTVCRTAYFSPKTEESQRVIDLAPTVVGILRAAKATAKGEFVLIGSDPDPAATYDFYRADCTWRELIIWLKGKGISAQKAVHALRKESGSLIASAFGIEAARQHLGHRDIRTTSSHYVAKRRRIEVDISPATLPFAGESARII